MFACFKVFLVGTLELIQFYHVLIYLLVWVYVFKYKLHKEQALHLYNKWKPSPLPLSCYHYRGTKIQGTNKYKIPFLPAA